MKSTPLARLSPSSELSQQTTPRILTLQDISGKPLQSALLGSDQRPDASQSERSLNISPTSSRRMQPKKKRKKHVQNIRIGLTAEEIERLNHSRHKNNSSLVSTLDAVSSSDSNNGRKNKLDELANAELRRSADSSSGEESPHDSFSCSEFEYDKRRPHRMFSKLAEGETGEAESFRGSLSTLVASDDDLAYIGFNGKNVNSADRRSAGETWDYLLNWGPNYSPLASVFKDIAELPESSACLPDDPGSGTSGMNNLNNVVARNSRYPTPRPNEEYV
jgi:protocadherin Fat 4